MAPQLHLAEHAFALQLFLERFQRLIDIIVTNNDLHLAAFSSHRIAAAGPSRVANKRRPGMASAVRARRYNTCRPLAKAFSSAYVGRMAILKIARMGHPVLLQKAAPVDDPTAPEIRRLIADMMETMLDAPGVGLAAPQVHVSLRLFVYRVPAARGGDDAEDAPLAPSVLINPEIEPLGDDIRLRWEGCLSIPGLRGAVARPWRIRYRGLDGEGAPVERIAAGLHAGVVQHETDHLDGILYPMRMSDFRLFGFDEELTRAAEQTS